MLKLQDVRARALRANHAENVRLHYFSARVSIYFTWLLAHTPITANQVTHLFTAFGIASAAVMFAPGLWPVVLGIVLFRTHMLLDVMDGEMARYRGTSSDLAAYQDYMTHYFVYPTFLFGAGVNAWLDSGSTLPLLLGPFLGHSYVWDLAARDTWYRANFGKVAKQTIDHIAPAEKHEVTKLGPKAVALRIVMELAGFSGFLFFYLIATALDVFGPIELPLVPSARTLVIGVFVAANYGRASMRVMLIARHRRVPRRSGLGASTEAP